jgi:hypothetical protein
MVRTADCACCAPPWDFKPGVPANDNTPWCGQLPGFDLFLQSGQFSSTLKRRLDVSSISNTPWGVSWDGTNTPWTGGKLYLQSGQFTSTLKTSEGGAIGQSRDISWDGADTPVVSLAPFKLFLQSGQFTSTVKTSEDVSSIDTSPAGISWTGTNTPWCGEEADKLYLQSGQFTSTVKTSEYIGGTINSAKGISWDNENTPWCAHHKLYLQSGQFTSTLKTSEDIFVGGFSRNIKGINTNKRTTG